MAEETGAGKAPADAGPSRRTAVGWALGMLSVLGLCWFAGAVVVPIWRAGAVIEDRFFRPLNRMVDSGSAAERDAVALEDLGGPERARRVLLPYLRTPWRSAGRKCAAIRLLGYCGAPAVPALVQALGNRDAEVRHAAAGALGMIGPDAAAAVPALEAATRDADELVPIAARSALEMIRNASGRVRE